MQTAAVPNLWRRFEGICKLDFSSSEKKKYKLHNGRCTGPLLALPHGTTPAAVTTNKNIKMSSFKSSENIQKKAGGPDRSVSDNQSSSVTLNELAMKTRKIL